MVVHFAQSDVYNRHFYLVTCVKVETLCKLAIVLKGMKIEGYLKHFEVLSGYQHLINEEIINFS